jgi:excinuclease UvrABC ATPase subunit
VLFARAGTPHCWVCGKPIASQSASQIVDALMKLPIGTKLMILSPLVRGGKGEHKDIFGALHKQGFVRARVDGEVTDLNPAAFPSLKKTFAHHIEAVVDRIVIKPEIRSRVADSVETALKLSQGLVIASVADESAEGKPGQSSAGWADTVYSEKFACPDHPEVSLPELEPRLFSFNSPHGACPDCHGLGTTFEFDPDMIVPDESISLENGAIEAWRKNGKRMNVYYARVLREFSRAFGVNYSGPYKDFPKKVRDVLMFGTAKKGDAGTGAWFEGVIPNLQRRFENTESEWVKHKLHGYMSEQPCATCCGKRLKKEALSVRLHTSTPIEAGTAPAPACAPGQPHDAAQYTVDTDERVPDPVGSNGKAPVPRDVGAKIAPPADELKSKVKVAKGKLKKAKDDASAKFNAAATDDAKPGKATKSASKAGKSAKKSAASVDDADEEEPLPDQSAAGGRKAAAPVSPLPPMPGYSVDDVTRMTVERAKRFFENLELSAEGTAIAEPIVREIAARLGFMFDVGLGYLTLDRKTGSLSGGEAQRIRLATQVGSGLVGVCYVLDEPTIGLHQRDNTRLIRTLLRLRDLGNTVLMVEHDEDCIRAADHLIDIGPGAGSHGGNLVADGPMPAVLSQTQSITIKYITGELAIAVPHMRRPVDPDKACIELKGCRGNNLKDVDVRIPLGGLVCVTGVSGSGKSTMVNQTLLPALKRKLYASKVKAAEYKTLNGVSRVDKVIEIDQSPIGRTPRSNPATYTGVFDEIRKVFTMTREAKLRGYEAGRFSFNVKGGRCESCQGQGTKCIEMHFLPDVYVACEVCHGARYNAETLQIHYRGKTIAEVLDMTCEEAIGFFENIPNVYRMLKALNEVGLTYVKLGQPSTQLSGGEAQRVKLASELGKNPTGHTLYVLDEPTTGLHFADIQNLLNVLNRLADLGNTVLVIEHNLDVIKCADWLIDMGPEGGEGGGRVIAEGTPEHVVTVRGSYTAEYLAPKLLPAVGATAAKALSA